MILAMLLSALAAPVGQQTPSDQSPATTKPDEAQNVSSVTPKPATPPATWVTENDYPAAALRAREQGTVGFTVDVGAKGEVTACAINASSGSSALDVATCNVVRARASFIPAHDAKGKPIAARWLGRFRWTFPLVATEELTKLPESSGYEVVLTIDEAGVMTACQPIRLLGKRYTRICDDVLAGSKKDITAYRVNGKPTRLKLRMTSIITYEAADAK